MQTATIEGTSENFGVLATQVREAGLLNRRFGYYGVMIPLTIAAYGIGFAGLVLVGNSWWALGSPRSWDWSSPSSASSAMTPGITRSSAPAGPTGYSGLRSATSSSG